MSRDIKFRAFIRSLKRIYDVEAIFINHGFIKIYRAYGETEFGFDEIDLLQYTGFNFKGKEIFEGDILELIIETDDEIMTDVGVVVMSDEGCWIVEYTDIEMTDLLCDLIGEDIKIIGNMYQSPELMEV